MNETKNEIQTDSYSGEYFTTINHPYDEIVERLGRSEITDKQYHQICDEIVMDVDYESIREMFYERLENVEVK